MKKHLYFMNSGHGFVLPYVMFVASIILIIVTANIVILKSEQFLTNQHIEQLKIETIIQSGKSMAKKDIIDHSDIKKTQYTFPDGTVEISITKLTHSEYHLHMTIKTKKTPVYSIGTRLFIFDSKDM